MSVHADDPIEGMKKTPEKCLNSEVFDNGAVRQIRTADLVITNDVLCQLSYNSMATRMRLELTTSSVTG